MGVLTVEHDVVHDQRLGGPVYKLRTNAHMVAFSEVAKTQPRYQLSGFIDNKLFQVFLGLSQRNLAEFAISEHQCQIAE